VIAAILLLLFYFDAKFSSIDKRANFVGFCPDVSILGEYSGSVLLAASSVLVEVRCVEFPN
jgi:hypothetical protein